MVMSITVIITITEICKEQKILKWRWCEPGSREKKIIKEVEIGHSKLEIRVMGNGQD